ncbi:SirB2 family protein [Rheinheimera sp. 4Y26]|uniref:SirB2 family protein n=1 Tax=Rheinheimera sp. 4Y26 TaxID=2977811 RepID=UPI0021B09C2F|nr:SirB2 family protein [Rheinheimera sp. 4Y26]MCT6699287.1 SirB2 family protein [Rheinheimera sp. 4Y26]
MQYYLEIKQIHMLCAYLSVSLFIGRFLLDMWMPITGGFKWRASKLRFVPHLVDTMLLTMALALLAVGPWKPFIHHWLGIKILLLVCYILCGKAALTLNYAKSTRLGFALLAVLLLAGIFYLARFKPLLF